MTVEFGNAPRSVGSVMPRVPERSYLRDWIYGGIDGAVTTFAIVAGGLGAQLSPVVLLVLGCANLLADGFSMAAGNFSGTKAERDEYEHLVLGEQHRIRHSPDSAREQITRLFAAKGFVGTELERVVAVLTSDEKRWIETILVETHGLTSTLRSPLKAALSTFAAFLLCGSVPLLSYLPAHSVAASVASTGAVFFAIGAIKSRWSIAPWWKSGIETLLVGMAAAGLAFIVGFGLKSIAT